jgi:hypothetical protein
MLTKLEIPAQSILSDVPIALATEIVTTFTVVSFYDVNYICIIVVHRDVHGPGLQTPPFHRRSMSPQPPSQRISSSSQWLFTKAEILESPSVRDGLEPQVEKANRSKGVLFIETVGYKLRLHKVTISTATMFLHRFYMREPMTRFHHYVSFLRFYGTYKRKLRQRASSWLPKLKKIRGNCQI